MRTTERARRPVGKNDHHNGHGIPAESPDQNGTARASPGLDILVVARNRDLLQSCRRILVHEGHRCQIETDGSTLHELVRRKEFDLILLDEGVVADLQLSTFAVKLPKAPRQPLLVVMSEDTSPNHCERALSQGAWDLLAKPFGASQLLALASRAWYTVRQARELGCVDENGILYRDDQGLTILGTSPALRKAVAHALRAAPTDATIMLTGESGTGKELFARLVHGKSPRANNEFVPINCAALPGELLESEMFGHRKGAFTGAVQDKEGLLETADEGTLFLDELAEMPPELQAKLLRVLEDGAIRRVGSESIDRKVDLRIVSATNRNVEEAVEEGLLRQDLFYRLQVVPIELPPLRRRPEDIPILVRHFTRQLWQHYRGMDGPPPTFSESAMEALIRHPWYGNVRELSNVIGNMVIFSKPGGDLRPDDLPLQGRKGEPVADWQEEALAAGNLNFDLHRPYHEAKEDVIQRFEREYIIRCVTQAGGNLRQAARKAGINRATLYRLMERHGLSRDVIMN